MQNSGDQADRTDQINLDLGRQLANHLLLLAAKEEGGDLLLEPFFKAAPQLQIRDIGMFLKAPSVTQQPRHEKAKERPQIKQAIFNGRAG